MLVNVQARELELGSGGFDVLYANLTRGLGLGAEEGAHVMVAAVHASAARRACTSRRRASSPSALDGMPVVCCSLHSQLAPVCAALAGARVAYVQLAGGALPVSLSDTVRVLLERGLVTATAAVAPCFDGDVQCVSSPRRCSGLAAAHDVAVCAIGPGIVGTGSRFGHGGLAAAEAANAAAALGGRAGAGRAGLRARTSGHATVAVSHHTEAVLALVRGDAARPRRQGGEDWRAACDGLPLSHMGRGPDDDPEFFAAAFAAGAAARRLLG